MDLTHDIISQLCEYMKSYKAHKYDPKIPIYHPTFEEISKQLRINADILKKEITDHSNKEIERITKSVDKIRF